MSGLARNRRSKGGANTRGAPEKMGRIGSERDTSLAKANKEKKRAPKKADDAHLCILKVSHKAPVDEALVEDVDESVILDMGSKAKLPVRCLHAPFFLELGGCLPVVCKAEMVSKVVHGGLRGPNGEERNVSDEARTGFKQVSVTSS